MVDWAAGRTRSQRPTGSAASLGGSRGRVGTLPLESQRDLVQEQAVPPTSEILR